MRHTVKILHGESDRALVSFLTVSVCPSLSLKAFRTCLDNILGNLDLVLKLVLLWARRWTRQLPQILTCTEILIACHGYFRHYNSRGINSLTSPLFSSFLSLLWSVAFWLCFLPHLEASLCLSAAFARCHRRAKASGLYKLANMPGVFVPLPVNHKVLLRCVSWPVCQEPVHQAHKEK